jgi:hypothetical protein
MFCAKNNPSPDATTLLGWRSSSVTVKESTRRRSADDLPSGGASAIVVLVVVVVAMVVVMVVAVALIATPVVSTITGSPGLAAVADPKSVTVTVAVSERSVINPTATAEAATRPSPPKIVTRRSMTRP